MVRLIAFEIIGVTRREHRRLLGHGHLQPPAKNDAALLALVNNLVPSGTGTGLVALLEQLNGFVPQIRADLQE